MTMNFKYRVIKYVIDIVTLCRGKIIELEDLKNLAKDKWKLPDVIP